MTEYLKLQMAKFKNRKILHFAFTIFHFAFLTEPFMKYEWFIGLRYLKAKRKQTFISIITVISIAGVMVGVMALIIVLAVMSGFEKTLKEKILGTYAHIVLLKAGQEGMDNTKR